MTSGETFSRSPLDKPLDQLTEEDISQITREDCRRYLKEKGMRRPSWNKSQAIQQVISLKALLETRMDSGAGTGMRYKISVTRPSNPPYVPLTSTASVKVTNADIQISATAEESVPYRRNDPPKQALFGDLSRRLLATDTSAISPRSTGAKNGTLGQMTIFYHGMVNVYNGVPADKAHTIMQLAAKRIYSPQDAPAGGITAVQPFPCHLQAASFRPCPIPPPAMIYPILQTAKMTEKSQHYREEGDMSREVEPGKDFS
ncbi:hypothetical protein HHK36_012696 [Tetracentron sinense]|uniref:Protein TIFY n=1 Tax=Tetracentron sinense TaxID=13715 RepID=A0A835CX57_TETSI|nr:hypothetical protein HHK36_032485 [Tetracentron sinense]KAF8401750.1 hypothetical protein HHK36_012696 [Tetracentron sinense]